MKVAPRRSRALEGSELMTQRCRSSTISTSAYVVGAAPYRPKAAARGRLRAAAPTTAVGAVPSVDFAIVGRRARAHARLGVRWRVARSRVSSGSTPASGQAVAGLIYLARPTPAARPG